MKQNLVLIHSFPTNSILLKGLIDYLNDYFNVFFIDLPGFNINNPPLKNITLESYSNYVEEKIKSYNLNSYWLGCVSFGFLIASLTKEDKKCKGIFAIEPYLNNKELNMTKFKEILYVIIINIILFTRVYNFLWHNNLIRKWLIPDHPKKQVKIMFNTIDPYTFFKTANLILKYNDSIRFHDKPHIMIINKKDKTIDPDEAIFEIKKAVKEILIIPTTSKHYPKTISKKYFEKHIKKDDIKRIIDYMNKK